MRVLDRLVLMKSIGDSLSHHEPLRYWEGPRKQYILNWIYCMRLEDRRRRCDRSTEVLILKNY